MNEKKDLIENWFSINITYTKDQVGSFHCNLSIGQFWVVVLIVILVKWIVQI